MKTVLAFVFLAATVTAASAQYSYGQRSNSYGGLGGYGTGSNPNGVYHQGYTTQSGTYVAPHYQSAPNTTQYDNWSTRGNQNPYTGAYGTKTPRW